MNGHILVVDDEPDIRALVRDILIDEGYEVSVAANAAEADSARRARRPDLVLLDIWMPDRDGIALLKEWSQGGGLDMPVVMMSGHGTVETAVEATRLGAHDFLEKPLSTAKLLVTVQRALEMASLKREAVVFKKQGAPEPLGHSRVMVQLRERVQRIAQHGTAVFVTGESGTGKELFARYLHASSPRSAGPFFAINVAGLTLGTVEREMFGSEDGGQIRFGALEQANGGTLLIKDIADLDPGVQARLLDALENQRLTRVGGRDPVRIDGRIVAATRRDLKEAVEAGRFRDDLYYHLNVLPLHIPPLRDHASDVPDLIAHYVDDFASREGLPLRRFPANTLIRLRGYGWPGNVRELKNLVQRLLILGGAETVEPIEIDQALGLRPASAAVTRQFGLDLPLREAREQFERAYLEHQLEVEQGNVSRVAEKIGIERTHLHRKLKTLGIDSRLIKQHSRDDGG
jgi:DNA-binding NtrC family response regulator